jgi:hypothetical protein
MTSAHLAAIWHSWWLLIIICILSVPGYISERIAVHHKRRLELAQAQTAQPVVIERERVLEREVRPPRPEGCQHRRVTEVMNGGKRVAWMCLNSDCREQLPPDYDFDE